MPSESTYPPHRLGAWGEASAAEALERHGWRILARNYRFGRREVDLVVRRGALIAFVEVKTRAGRGFGRPEAALTRLKRREIEVVAEQYLIRHNLDLVDVRFDVVAIEVDARGRTLRFEHLEDAWRPESR